MMYQLSFPPPPLSSSPFFFSCSFIENVIETGLNNKGIHWHTDFKRPEVVGFR